MGSYAEALHDGKDPVRIVVNAEHEIQQLQQDIENIVMYAFRYALGRSSYSVNDVCVTISKYKETLDSVTINAIKREIKDYLESAPHGFTREWQDLLKELNNDPKSYSMSTLAAYQGTKETNEGK